MKDGMEALGGQSGGLGDQSPGQWANARVGQQICRRGVEIGEYQLINSLAGELPATQQLACKARAEKACGSCNEYLQRNVPRSF